MAKDTVTVFHSDADGKWRWHRQAPNGKIVSDSAEGYEHKEHAVKMAEKLNGDAKVVVED